MNTIADQEKTVLTKYTYGKLRKWALTGIALTLLISWHLFIFLAPFFIVLYQHNSKFIFAGLFITYALQIGTIRFFAVLDGQAIQFSYSRPISIQTYTRTFLVVAAVGFIFLFTCIIASCYIAVHWHLLSLLLVFPLLTYAIHAYLALGESAWTQVEKTFEE